MEIRNHLWKIIKAIRNFLKKYFNSDNEYLPFIISLLFGLILAILTLNGFEAILDKLRDETLSGFDTSVAEYIQSYRSTGFNKFFITITDFGDKEVYIILTIALAAYFYFRKKNWRLPTQVAIVLVLSSLVNGFLKRWVNRPRPLGEHLVEVSSMSFPSGHSMSAMAFYGFLIYLVWRYGERSWIKIGLTFLLVFLIGGIGISRVYLGVHYPSDVVAGFLGGLFWVGFCIVVFNILSILRKRREGRSTIPKA